MDLRILFVEDSADDAALLLRRLHEAGVEARWERVASAESLHAALTASTWDVALVDYDLPGFGGPAALRLIAQEAPDLPTITVSGAIDEDTAVATLTAGAVDYVLKDNLARLAPAVRRALEGAELRRRQRLDAESARQSRFAVEHASQAIIYIAADGTLLFANEAATRLGGVPLTGALGRSVGDWVPDADPRSWAALWEAAAEGPVVDVEVTVHAADGRERLVSATLERLEHDTGAFMIVYLHDITEQRAAEERALAGEAMYRRIVEMAGEGIWVTDADHTTVFVNDQLARILGCAPEDVVGRPVTDFIFPEDLPVYAAEMDRRAAGLPGAYSGRFRRADGSAVWISASTVAQLGPDGEYLGSFGMFTDVSERLQAETALRLEQANLAAIFASSPVALMVLDERLTVTRVNPAAVALTGTSLEDLLEYRPASTVTCGAVLGCRHESDDPRGCGFSDSCRLCGLRNALEPALAGGQPVHGLELPIDVGDGDGGRRVWLRVGARPVAIDGTPHMIVALDDVTEGTEAQTALRMFRTIADHATYGAAIADGEGVLTYVNDTMAAMHGWTPQELLGRHVTVFHDEEQLPGFRELYERLASDGGFAAEEMWHVRRDGSVFPALMTATRVDDPARGAPFSSVTMLDISDRVRAEEALRDREERYRSLFEDSPVAMWEDDYSAVKARLEELAASGIEDVVAHVLASPEEYRRCVEHCRSVDANQAAVAMFDAASREELLARNADLYLGDTVSGAHHFWSAMLRGERSATYEETNTSLTGRRVDVLETCTVVPGHEDTFDRVYISNIDITERKRAEEALRESERLFAEFAGHMPVWLWIRDADLRLRYVNAHIVAEIGRSEAQLLGTTPGELWDADSAARSAGLHERALRGEVVDDLSRWRLSTGGSPADAPAQVFRSLLFPIVRRDGSTVVGGLAFDVTDEQQAFEAVRRNAERLRRTVEGAVVAMSGLVETRDPYTAGHERRVAELVVAVAAEMGMTGAEIDGLRLAALVHDIGKIGVPAEILSKPGSLSPVEFDLIKQHPRAGHDILAAIEFDAPVAQLVLQHHERMDGSGYPEGLAGDDVIPGARILAVADVVEAMSSHRPYRAALGLDAALAEIRAGAGVKYDADVAAACLRVAAAGFAFDDAPAGP